MKKVGLSILLVSLLAACASQKTKPEAPAAAAAPQPAAEAPKAAAVTVDPLNDPNSILAKRSVYYPFDVSVVQDADKPLLLAHAKYLSEHPNRHVRLEGNCDERGSTEYNLGLGQRRADGVKKMLELNGANASQLTTISFGEEKPRLTCHAEKCWKENRRTDLNYNVN
jgi:peptidoglycan-associated lipoprotein